MSGDVQITREEWPRIDFDSAGNFVIAWLDIVPADSIYPKTNSGIDYARMYWSDGTARTAAFRVMPDTMRARNAPCIASLRDGSFWVFFNDRAVNLPVEAGHTFASQFDAAGHRLIGPVAITSSMHPESLQVWPSQADLSVDGSRIAIGLMEDYFDKVYVMQLDSLANPIGAIQRLDSSDEFVELVDFVAPVVSFIADGKLAVSFQALVHQNPDYTWDHVLRRIYDSMTVPLGDLRVSYCGDSIDMDCAFYTQCPVSAYPHQVAYGSGNYFATASSIYTCNGFPWAYFQSFNHQGDSLSAPFPLNDPGSITLNNWLIPRMATDGKGLFVVAWMDGRYYGIYDSKADLVAQLVDSAGNKHGKNIVINSIPQSPGAIVNEYDVAIHDSQVVIAWSDYRNGPAYSFDIYCQMMDLRDFVWFMPGDCDGSRDVTTADIIWLVNYVFKSGSWPQPRVESGDVNADCSISAADVIVTVNFVFKSGLPLSEGCAGY